MVWWMAITILVDLAWNDPTQPFDTAFGGRGQTFEWGLKMALEFSKHFCLAMFITVHRNISSSTFHPVLKSKVSRSTEK